MALATFSAIIDFALQGERTGLEFFAAAVRSAPETKQAALARLQAAAEKNLKLLQAVLREQVTEMVMEPCEPVPEASYALDVSGDDPLGIALRLLEKQRDFLRHAAQAINLGEVKRALERIAERKNQLISEISR